MVESQKAFYRGGMRIECVGATYDKAVISRIGEDLAGEV
jgi:hypothetical protein